jgi:hypothetical protein
MADEFDLNDVVDPNAGKQIETSEEPEEYDEDEYLSVRQQLKQANKDFQRTRRTSQAASPRRKWVFEPKLTGVPRVVRDPNPGYNSDPIYTAASQAHYNFQNTTMADYEAQKEGYDYLLKEHNEGRGPHPGMPPVMPEAPAEAKAIRAPSEANRWRRARDRAISISQARSGVARQFSGRTGSGETDGTDYRRAMRTREGTQGSEVLARIADDSELAVARKAAAERAKRAL